MEKEFIPYELALELKQLGFDEPCFGYYNDLGGKQLAVTERDLRDSRDYINNTIEWFLAPIFQQAFRWFREKHGICGYVSPLEDGSAFYHMIYTNISAPYSNRICTLPEKWETHEEAELECLRKLIEIVKTYGGNK